MDSMNLRQGRPNSTPAQNPLTGSPLFSFGSAVLKLELERQRLGEIQDESLPAASDIGGGS
jgi:hypothetical protein